MSGCLSASADPDTGCNGDARFFAEGDSIKLEAHGAPLSRVLDLIASTAGLRIHAVAIPEPRVSAVCDGTALEPIIECLFGRDTDFVVEAAASDGQSGNDKAKDVWILGANFGQHGSIARARSTVDCDGATHADRESPQTPVLAAPQGLIPPPNDEETAALVEMATAQESWQRIQALTRLGTAREGADERIRATLRHAMSDPDPDVRAQAVAGLARHGDGDKAEVLHEAMRDSHASVRMMAVGIVSNDAHGEALLREALADSDPTVQELAAMKLEALLAQDGTN